MWQVGYDRTRTIMPWCVMRMSDTEMVVVQYCSNVEDAERSAEYINESYGRA